MQLPFKGKNKLTSTYGMRTLDGQTKMHKGIDLVGVDDKTVYSPADGEVLVSRIVTDKSNNTWKWGNYVCIGTNDGLQIYMCHLSKRFVKMGDKVKVGDPIGIEGNTGYSFGSHTHFEIRENGVSVNPAPYLNITNEKGEYVSMTIKIDNGDSGNTPDEWAKEAVDWAIKNGILRGTNATNPEYHLHDNVTRQEMIVMIHRALKVVGLIK